MCDSEEKVYLGDSIERIVKRGEVILFGYRYYSRDLLGYEDQMVRLKYYCKSTEVVTVVKGEKIIAEAGLVGTCKRRTA